MGSLALTTRGFKEGEIKRVAKWIKDVLAAPEDAKVRERVKGEIKELTPKFPLYPELLKGL